MQIEQDNICASVITTCISNQGNITLPERKFTLGQVEKTSHFQFINCLLYICDIKI